MNKALKIFGVVLLTVILALGWSWSQLLKARGYITDIQQTRLLISLTVILALQRFYLELPKPVSRDLIVSRQEILNEYLKGLITKYYKTVKTIQRNKEIPPPTIRVNIMLPTKRFKGLFGIYLRIYYYNCPTNLVVYPDQELSMKWRKNDGTCGWAWKHKDISIYDSEVPELKLPEARLKRQKEESIQHIKSTLSVPIWYNAEVVGILNLDSKHNVTETFFHDEKIYMLAAAYAKTLGSLCFSDGVQA